MVGHFASSGVSISGPQSASSSSSWPLKVHRENAVFGVIIVRVVVCSYIMVLVVVFLLMLGLRCKQVHAIVRPLVRTNDELAQELVAQAVEVFALELSVLALLQI